MESSASSTAYQIGFTLGVVITILLTVGVLAFCIFALVQAFRKRTTGWIVTGSICGVLLLLPLFAVLAAFAAGFAKGFREARERKADDSQLEATAATIEGRGIAYTFQVPSGWNVKRGVNDFDALANSGSLYVGVIAEEADLGNPVVIAGIARERLQEVSTDLHLTDLEPLVVDGRDWLQFNAECRVQKVPLAYRFYVYSGQEGTFQIIGWTTQDLADQKAASMRHVMETFRFPEKR